MTLYERYIGAETMDLLRILESSLDYTKECIAVVEEIIKERNITLESNLDDILLINRNIINKKLNKFNPLKNKLDYHESFFLSETEIEELYKKELLKFIKKQDHFGFDVWSYAVGGL